MTRLSKAIEDAYWDGILEPLAGLPPAHEFTANRDQLARELSRRDWNKVSRAYTQYESALRTIAGAGRHAGDRRYVVGAFEVADGARVDFQLALIRIGSLVDRPGRIREKRRADREIETCLVQRWPMIHADEDVS